MSDDSDLFQVPHHNLVFKQNSGNGVNVMLSPFPVVMSGRMKTCLSSCGYGYERVYGKIPPVGGED